MRRIGPVLALALLSLLVPSIARALAGPGTETTRTPGGLAALPQSGADEIRLRLPEGASWSRVNVARLIVRQADSQRTVAREGLPDDRLLPVRIDDGCALVLAEVGAPEDRGHPDSWRRVRRATKQIGCAAGSDVRAAAEARWAATGAVTAKTGSRVEIQPLVNPLVMGPGADLPVRIFVDGAALAGATVVARGPGGDVTATSDVVGLASLRLPAAGEWLVWFTSRSDGVERTAELRFTLANEPVLPEVRQ